MDTIAWVIAPVAIIGTLYFGYCKFEQYLATNVLSPVTQVDRTSMENMVTIYQTKDSIETSNVVQKGKKMVTTKIVREEVVTSTNPKKSIDSLIDSSHHNNSNHNNNNNNNNLTPRRYSAKKKTTKTFRAEFAPSTEQFSF